MKILVTGGAGYLGGQLVPRLLRANHKVRVYDNLEQGNSLTGAMDEQNLDVVKGDILDEKRLGKAAEGVEAVIHLTSLRSEACESVPAWARKINVEGTSLAQTVAGDTPFIMVSTCSVYGRTEGEVDESTEPKPVGAYGKTKVEAESVVLANNGAVVRFGTLYGYSPLMRWDLILHQFVTQARNNRLVEIYDPNAWRPLLHVQDAAGVLERTAANFSPGLANVPGQNFTKMQIAEKVSEYFPTGIKVVKKGDFRSYKVKSLLNRYDRVWGLDDALGVFKKLYDGGAW